MAIPNSDYFGRPWCGQGVEYSATARLKRLKTGGRRNCFFLWFALFWCLGCWGTVLGQSTNRALEAARAQKAFQEMQTRWRENPNNPQSAWHFGHACFDW